MDRFWTRSISFSWHQSHILECPGGLLGGGAPLVRSLIGRWQIFGMERPSGCSFTFLTLFQLVLMRMNCLVQRVYLFLSFSLLLLVTFAFLPIHLTDTHNPGCKGHIPSSPINTP